jgi:hypothetical protein
MKSPRYRSTTNVNLPFRVNPIVREVGKSTVEYTVQVKANFNPKLTANNVVVKIPTPLNTTKVDCKVQMGKAKYVPAENVVVWKCVKRPSPSFSPRVIDYPLTRGALGSRACRVIRRRRLALLRTCLRLPIAKLGPGHRSASIFRSATPFFPFSTLFFALMER